MSTAASPATFEIKVNGAVRSYRDVREAAIEAARFLQARNPGSTVTVTDLRDGSTVPLDRECCEPMIAPVPEFQDDDVRYASDSGAIADIVGSPLSARSRHLVLVSKSISFYARAAGGVAHHADQLDDAKHNGADDHADNEVGQHAEHGAEPATREDRRNREA